ncbi:hypothetical protein [Nonomuraea sp. NPDC050643]|uniref:hypothetical protein n=1 Tax=Nonomuraea sp. NPDC050643 TaxID=3155660 RepID=UPI0033FDF963
MPDEESAFGQRDAAVEYVTPAGKPTRLTALKDVYVFHLNHNIRPSTGREGPGRGLG